MRAFLSSLWWPNIAAVVLFLAAVAVALLIPALGTLAIVLAIGAVGAALIGASS